MGKKVLVEFPNEERRWRAYYIDADNKCLIRYGNRMYEVERVEGDLVKIHPDEMEMFKKYNPNLIFIDIEVDCCG